MESTANLKMKDEQEKSKTEGSKSQRILRVDQIYSRKDRQIHYVKTAKSSLTQAKYERMNKTTLVVRRIISKQGMVASTEVDIKSMPLRDILLEIFEGVEGLQLNKTPPVADPELLFHALPSLEKRLQSEEAKDVPNKSLTNDLNSVLEFIREDFGRIMASLDSLSEHDEITFDLLWALFPPNTIVYTKDNMLKEAQTYRFLSGSYEKQQDGSQIFQMRLRMIGHDGQELGWGEQNLQIGGFEGAKKVYHLATFPLSVHPEKEAARADLIRRGRRFVDLLKTNCKEYNGTAITEDRKIVIRGSYKAVRFFAHGRIMLDPVTFRQQNAYSDLMLPYVSLPVNPETFKDDEFLLCSHSLLGFSFSQKKWGVFAISKVTDVQWNAAAFNKLVMDSKKRDLVHTLVKSHRNDGVQFDDIVEGKGKGLVGLLSGSPGVGKTLTAEVVSEVTKRPLYMVSAGELGTQVYEVDERLEMVLEITRRWGCLLLIDEADVFLQKRDGLDLQRNSLVSIFLRRIEYFQGILIMTTNRKNIIDAAFESRIHFKLHYDDLDEVSRATVWKNCLGSGPSDLARPNFSDEEFKSLAKLKLNGRQIKNACACAFSIAVEDKKPLTMEGIRMILDIVVEDVEEGD